MYVTHCTGCVLAKTKPHQLCWGNQVCTYREFGLLETVG